MGWKVRLLLQAHYSGLFIHNLVAQTMTKPDCCHMIGAVLICMLEKRIFDKLYEIDESV